MNKGFLGNSYYDKGWEYAQYGARGSYIPDFNTDDDRKEWLKGYSDYLNGKEKK